MNFKLLIFVYIFSYCYAENPPKSDLRHDGGPSEGASVRIPLVKHGTDLDLLSVLQMSSNHKLGIIGGLPTNITAHPYQVAIDNGKTFVCAGALLNKIWVVTLASCADGAKPSDLTVRIGSNSNLHGGTVMNVSQIVVHPNFNYSNMDYDVALLKFSSYICFDTTSEPINLSTKKPLTRSRATVSGWGSRKSLSQSSHSTTFYELSMMIMAHNTCQNLYDKSHDVITDRMFCAIAGDKGPCHNDFGDPMIVNDTLYGLYSWSRGCSSTNFPAVFSNLASVSDWMYTVMNNACMCGVY